MQITVTRRAVVSAVLLATSITSAGVPVDADHTPAPTTVTVAGSLQSELGCPGDWQPECVSTHLTFDAGDDVWQGTFSVPAGDWGYKAALQDSWAENYGGGGVFEGPDIPLSLVAQTDVKFLYSHETHWITDNQSSVIATAAGDFQSELGCPGGDWQPDCLRSWLQDPDGDGIYAFRTDQLPPGDYKFKVALDEGWDVNYGADGVQAKVLGPGRAAAVAVTAGERVGAARAHFGADASCAAMVVPC